MRIIIFLCGALLAIGCKRDKFAPPAAAAATNQTYIVHGVVQAISPDHRHATIKHEAIPGYMAAMTMDFSVRDTNALTGLAPGDEVTFTLEVTADDDWIKNLRRLGKSGVTGPPGWHIAEPELAVGDRLPDAEFTSELGREIRFSDYRGQAVAFTFFFTSCPLPEYCPRMNKNFLEARRLLKDDPTAPGNWQMLSISFDPEVDQPRVLAGYAGIYRGLNPDRWLFVVASSNSLAQLAPKLDLNFWRENGSISHNLRTVVVAADGKIFKQFDGNDWTPEQLAGAIRAAAKTSAP